jgi:uncharacterized protein YbjT (DUF2867 family)
MRIAVIGGGGLIGYKLVNNLREEGHQVVAASPRSGVNTLTGEGLAEAVDGASVAVDLTKAPFREDAAVTEFFIRSTRNLLSYEADAGVGHHVVLSVVGPERLVQSDYFRAKIAQEDLIKASSIPYSIVRATQIYEFVQDLANFSTDSGKVHLPSVFIQPIASDDVASTLGRVALSAPLNGAIEVGGPDQFRLDELVRLGLSAAKDPREVFADPHARYYGIDVEERSLVPDDDARLGAIRFENWLAQSNVRL